MNRRTVFFVSDQTGITAETLGRSLLAQFEPLDFQQVTLPFISSIDKANDAVRRIDLAARVEGRRPVVFATFAQQDLRDIVKACQGLFLDFFDAYIGPLELEFNQRSSHRSGRAHSGIADESYQRRIDAMNFALANDDGIIASNYDRADVVLLGVSRSGKTPTCLYLALHYGVYAANYPLTEETFERGDLPAHIKRHQSKLFGLTIDPDHLHRIRCERRPDSRYASIQQISFELREAMALYRRYGMPSLDTTHSSVEEISSTIMHRLELNRGDALR